MTTLRAIGVRVFVHIEMHTPRLRDKAWEIKLCRFSHNSRMYRIFNSSKRAVVESRNVTFLETPPDVLLALDMEIDRKEMDCAEQDAYINGDIDDTSFLDPLIVVKSGENLD